MIRPHYPDRTGTVPVATTPCGDGCTCPAALLSACERIGSCQTMRELLGELAFIVQLWDECEMDISVHNFPAASGRELAEMLAVRTREMGDSRNDYLLEFKLLSRIIDKLRVELRAAPSDSQVCDAFHLCLHVLAERWRDFACEGYRVC